MTDSWLGQVIAGRYRIDERIGTGGMAHVYRGEHVHMRKRVAIKLLKSGTQKLPELVSRFEREAIAGAHIDHPNVANATDFGKLDDGSYFLVQEYVRGPTLRTVLDQGPLTPKRAAAVAQQIAAGLSAVHAAGVVHRDLKPANVMLGELEGEAGAEKRDVVKIIDFGLARVEVARLSTTSEIDDPLKGRGPLTGTGQVFGTPKYMAPETIGGMDTVDARSDLYTLGVVLYEMLTGKRPWEIEDPVELFGKKASQDPAPVSALLPDVPPALEAVTMRLLARDPLERYQDANAVVAALDGISLEPGALSLVPKDLTPTAVIHSDPPPPLPRRKPSPMVLGILGAAALLVLVIAGAVVVRKARGVTATTTPPGTSATTMLSAPDAPPTAAAPEPVGPGSRAALWRAIAKHDPRGAATALMALAESEPAAFHEPDVQAAAGNVAFGIDALDPAVANTVFDVLANKLGADGVDVLFDIVRTRGADKGGGKRAMALLRDDAVLAHASPALRIELEMRQAGCAKKRELYDRAVSEGDARVLTEMKMMRSAACGKKAGPCCWKTDKPLFDAINALKQRLGVP